MIEKIKIDNLFNAYKKDYRFPLPKIDIDDLLNIINIVFFASIKEEERRPIYTTIGVFESISTFPSLESNGSFSFRFTDPKEFTISNLAKISMAFDHIHSILCISKNPDNKYVINGVINLNHDDIKGIGLFGNRTTAPFDIVISTLKPGVIQLTSKGRILGTYRDDIFSLAKINAFTDDGLGAYILPHVKLHKQYRENQRDYYNIYRYLLRYILQCSLNTGEGGIFVWINFAKKKQNAFRQFSQPYLIDNFPNTSDVLQNICEIQKKYILSRKENILHQLLHYKKKAQDLGKFIANLSRVDGAVIINDYLKVLTFGSKLNSPKWKNDVLEGKRDRFLVGPDKKMDFSTLGTRHHSAINFAGSTDESIVFVISQDSSIKAFAKNSNNNKLYCWEDCLSDLTDM